MTDQVSTTNVPVPDDEAGRHVRVISLDDGKANALSAAMIADIRTAVTQAETDADCVAVVIAGREGRFSAGFDLSVIRGGDRSAITNLVADGGDLVRHLFGATVPVVIACTGHGLAAGALMLLGADVRVGAEGPFKIGLNEVAIGMTLPGWAYTIATERLSRRHLQRALLNARLTDAPTAVDAGFLDMAVAPDQVLDTAIAEATALAALDPRAYAGMIREFRGEVLVTMADQIAADRARA